MRFKKNAYNQQRVVRVDKIGGRRVSGHQKGYEKKRERREKREREK